MPPGPGGEWAQDCVITPFKTGQKEAIKLAFDNEKDILAFEQFYNDTQWSKEPDTLVQQMNMLSDIVNNDSAQKTLVGEMLKEYTGFNELVEAAAPARNDAYGSDPLGSGHEGQNRYYAALSENSEKLRIPNLKTGWVLLDGFDHGRYDVGDHLESWGNSGII
ncbi:hypothetical protein PG994_004586 [Apiospora phragmitis]|uniref:Uncharacterized protein n=1 Tax=Apiospora phragmitis TaxID=2905665 RepID=A0ABR1VS68_9PEZI